MLTYDFDDRKNGETLYDYLYRRIRDDIITGYLRPGERMPSKRSFASNLGVSVITVEAAYGQLTAEGYLSSRPRSGYYVEKINEQLLTPDIKHGSVRKRSGGDKNYEIKAEKEACATQPGTGQIDLATAGTESSMFPYPVWSRLMRDIMRTRQKELLERSPGQGLQVLREAIAGYLTQFRSLNVSPEQIIVGAGTEYLYGLLIRLLGPGHVYAVESPGYLKTARIYESCLVKTVPVSMDENGINTEELERSGADVVHISPSHQFPTGITMPVSRRSALLAWSLEGTGKRYIIEDDYDSEFRLSGRPIPALMSIDRSGNVIYLNTFTKSMAPTIRIAYMVLPEELLARYRKKLGFYSCTVSNFEQYILSEFIRQGWFEKHINRMRKHYRQKRDRLLEAICDSGLGERVSVKGADAGLHFLMYVESALSEEQLTAAAYGEGVIVRGLHTYDMKRQNRSSGARPVAEEDSVPCLVVSFSALTDDQIPELAARLARAWLK